MQSYMAKEKFKPGAFAAVYEHFAAQGRMSPEGLLYLDFRVFRSIWCVSR